MEFAWRLTALCLCLGVFISFVRIQPLDARGSLAVLASVTAAFMVYPFVDIGRHVVMSDKRLEEVLSLPRGVGAYAVLLSTAGLIGLSYDRFGVLSFCVMTLPLWATLHEMKKFQSAGETYEQTVRALGQLVERAGYVPPGHHERVATISAALAKEVGLPQAQVEKLRLVALLHDVGSASLSDPEDLRSVDRRVVARNGARLLDETGYLAGFAEILEEAGGSDPPRLVEARILRLANLYDEALNEVGSTQAALRRAQARAGASEPELVRHLQQVVAGQTR